ncbi:hypothetical protein GF325_05545 [Candidatus Bathyarchaeota archaeon]|nr:hypothetical protein [Candidatus Bathyarchaeota archaeon]
MHIYQSLFLRQSLQAQPDRAHNAQDRHDCIHQKEGHPGEFSNTFSLKSGIKDAIPQDLLKLSVPFSELQLKGFKNRGFLGIDPFSVDVHKFFLFAILTDNLNETEKDEVNENTKYENMYCSGDIPKYLKKEFGIKHKPVKKDDPLVISRRGKKIKKRTDTLKERGYNVKLHNPIEKMEAITNTNIMIHLALLEIT